MTKVIAAGRKVVTSRDLIATLIGAVLGPKTAGIFHSALDGVCSINF